MEQANSSTNAQKSHMQTAAELLLRKGELNGKQEMLNKLSPVVNGLLDERKSFQDKLTEHMKKQTQSNEEAGRIYEEAMIRREENAKRFCQGKTAEEFKEYLAGEYIPYNSWKDADLDTLIKLTMDVYDEEEL